WRRWAASESPRGGKHLELARLSPMSRAMVLERDHVGRFPAGLAVDLEVDHDRLTLAGLDDVGVEKGLPLDDPIADEPVGTRIFVLPAHDLSDDDGDGPGAGLALFQEDEPAVHPGDFDSLVHALRVSRRREPETGKGRQDHREKYHVSPPSGCPLARSQRRPA